MFNKDWGKSLARCLFVLQDHRQIEPLRGRAKSGAEGAKPTDSHQARVPGESPGYCATRIVRLSISARGAKGDAASLLFRTTGRPACEAANAGKQPSVLHGSGVPGSRLFRW